MSQLKLKKETVAKLNFMDIRNVRAGDKDANQMRTTHFCVFTIEISKESIEFSYNHCAEITQTLADGSAQFCDTIPKSPDKYNQR